MADIVTGVRDIDRKLKRLDRKIAKGAVQRAAVTASQAMLTTARALAPKFTGKLALTMEVKKFSGKGGVGARLITGTRAKLGIEKSATGYYPMSQEAGWKDAKTGRHHKGQPYMRPAMNRHQEQVRVELASEIRKEIRAAGSP